MNLTKRVSLLVVGGLALILATEAGLYINECSNIKQQEKMSSKQYMIGSLEMELADHNSWFDRALYFPIRKAYQNYIDKNKVQ